MLCPYCNTEMTKGYIHAGKRETPIWSPKPEKRTILLGKDDLWVGEPGSHTLPPAYHCRACRKIIICCGEE
ncbi:MAG: hypothetical protein IJX14_03200 [Clostridia bacterium]|nr:hypothetical protein [Clostridia bacterium]